MNQQENHAIRPSAELVAFMAEWHAELDAQDAQRKAQALSLRNLRRDVRAQRSLRRYFAKGPRQSGIAGQQLRLPLAGVIGLP